MTYLKLDIFTKYVPKYSASYLTKIIKGRTSREYRKGFPNLKGWCERNLWAPSCYNRSVEHGWEVVEKCFAGQDRKLRWKVLFTGFGN